jgi:antiviral helicase SKI2
MTTEILLIMLSKKKMSNLDFNIDIEKEVYSVIFDEVHYINDPERGHVWEKSIMIMPNNVNMIMLSATIEKPEAFLYWVNEQNFNPTYLLSNEKRVVPLHFSYMLFSTYKFEGLNSKHPNKFLENSSAKNYVNKLNFLMETEKNDLKDTSIDKFLSFYNYFQNEKINKTWLINEICKFLEKNEMCPAIFFIFSKKACINIANSIQKSYITSDESISVEKDFNYYLSKLEHKNEYLNTPQYHSILNLAKKGIAVHHSGLIPVYKEIIEMLFSKQLIKVLFATETFSVGLNMPTKTVISNEWTSWKKRFRYYG